MLRAGHGSAIGGILGFRKSKAAMICYKESYNFHGLNFHEPVIRKVEGGNTVSFYMNLNVKVYR